MNFIKHFKNWITRIEADERLRSHHLGLYNALFYYWNANRFRNPITIIRQEIMTISKIGSVNTYTKALKELTEWGYIRYEPSFSSQLGSKVHLHRFDKDSGKGRKQGSSKGGEQGSEKGGSKDTSKARRKTTDKAPATYYINNPNSINILNNLNGINAHEPIHEISDVIDGGKTNAHRETIHTPGPGGTEAETKTKTKAPGGRRGATQGSPDELAATAGGHEQLDAITEGLDQLKANAAPGQPSPTARSSRQVGRAIREAIPDSVEKVQAYFLELNAPATEAERFFNYFESNGWQVGGKTPMKDWRAAARNWISNAPMFASRQSNQPKPGKLNTGPKNYAEPF